MVYLKILFLVQLDQKRMNTFFIIKLLNKAAVVSKTILIL